MDKFENLQSQHFKKSLDRVEKIYEKLVLKEKRYSFFRLFLTLLIISLIFSKWQNFNFNEKFFSVIGFLGSALLLVKIHNFLKKKINLSLSYKKSYLNSIYRAERTWGLLTKEKLEFKPLEGHPYVFDLDINTQVPLWLGTCVLAKSNENLMERICLAGITPPPAAERVSQAKRCQYLRNQTVLLRRLDSHRYLETSQKVELSPENFKELMSSKKTYNQVFIICLIVCLAWGGFLIPAYIQFWSTQDTENFFHSLLFFMPFPLFGAIWLKPWSAYAQYWSGEVRSAIPLLKGVMALPEEFMPTGLKGAQKAFTAMNRINVVLDALEVRGNPLLWFLLHALIPYDGLLGFFLSRSVKVLEGHWPQWREGLMSFDMDCALSRASVEDKGLSFFSETKDETSVKNEKMCIESMGHPLIPLGKRVLNSLDLDLNHPARLLTGSNMSGKSTFLRSLGLNMVLYNLGGPVCAQRMVSPSCLVLCAIRVEDSLSNATSYFYAEVKRLSFILKTLSQETRLPAIYLVDEIFKGTNNKERIWGSWYVIQALLDSGSFGVVSTHDLALADLESKDGRILNCHFKETVSQGELVFDYTLRSGPCPTTNALHIMRMEGLPVPLQLPENFNLV